MRSDGRNRHHVPPYRIGAAAYRYLSGRARSGLLVSRFSGGINLLFEDGEAFISVQTSAVPLHPWAVELPGTPLRVAEGTSASSDGSELSIGDLSLPLSAARIEDLILPPPSPAGVAVARRNLPILARSVEEAQGTHPPDPFQPEIDAIIERWRRSEAPELLLDLIGLGAGSTPTGDDVLLGIIAGMSLFEDTDDRVAESLARLRAGIQETARPRTPLPSAQMLLAACNRSFPEPLLGLLGSLTSPSTSEDAILKRTERVAQLGYHSGIGVLLGLMGLYACLCNVVFQD